MTSKIIIEPSEWTATLDESVCFGVYESGARFTLVGNGSTPEEARINLAAHIACFATGDLTTALGELATDSVIHAALKRVEENVVFYEEWVQTYKDKRGFEYFIAANRHAAEALRNLISSMKEHTQ